MTVTLELEYANEGWHVRWRTPDTETFERTREAFKAILPLTDRYWDPDAFNGRGGWWVLYGSLDLVNHLFANYLDVRIPLEKEHQRQFAQKQKEAREQRIREETLRRMRAQKTKTKRQEPLHRRKAEPKTAPPPPKSEPVKLPQTWEEALKVLRLTAPVTKGDIKRAFYAEAKKCHPDRGGSNEAMIRLNAAYELLSA